MTEEHTDNNEGHTRRRRRRSRRRGPLLPTIYFCLLGIIWIGWYGYFKLYRRDTPLTTSDYVVGGLLVLLALFYFWVAIAVYRRKRYILDVAFACAGISLLSFPLGTAVSVLLLSSLMSRKHDFTK